MKLFKPEDINETTLNELTQRRRCDFSKEKKEVEAILAKVSETGDKALCEYTQQFDGVALSAETLRVSEAVLKEAQSQVSKEVQKAIQKAIKNVRDYQIRLVPSPDCLEINNGFSLGSRVIPLKRIGAYIPAGSAPLVSTVLMTLVPATVAGVQELVVVSPPSYEGRIHPAILYACDLCGVTEVYAVGGAQSIGALAYGTDQIKRVDKIVGPGNIYVTLAKKEVYGLVDIDMVAGPSEIMVIADQEAPIDWVAYDLMSQAEHDPLSSSYLVTFDKDYAEKIIDRFEKLMQDMPRKDIIAQSWKDNACIFVVDSDQQAVQLANYIAPEHLELMVVNAEKMKEQIDNAGAIFMGYYTPEAVGDYTAGPSHVLPTGGSARFFSPLSPESFVKRTSLIGYNESRLKEEAKEIMILARLEGLEAHAKSVEVRLK